MFQNFFTKILYKQGSDNNEVARHINNMCKMHSHEIWKKLMSIYYEDEQQKSEIIDEKKFYDGWNNTMRFYLKGGKATLDSIERIIDSFKEQESIKIPEELSLIDITQPQYQKSGIFKAFYHEFSKSTEDSDFDFCFLLHPSLIQSKQHAADRKLTKIIKDHSIIMNNEFLDLNLNSKFIEFINKNIMQLYNTIRSFDEEQLLYFTEQQVNFFNTLNNENYQQKLKFEYENESQSVQSVAKKVQIDTDIFYLYRIIIPLKFVDNESNRIFSNLSNKLFAECIDISFSVKSDVANMLWTKSSLDVILKPLYPLYLFDYPIKKISNAFMYPVVSSSYQINDILVVLSEADPNKPQKRCKRFLEQLYFACAEEQMPSLPSKIMIGKSIYNLMQQEENECNELNSIMTLSKQTENTFEFEVKLRNLDQFEQWCKKSTYNKVNLSWSSQCNFISKDKLITYVQNLVGSLYDYSSKNTKPAHYYNLPYDLLKSTTNFICEFYKQLLLLDVCIILLLIDGEFHKFTNDQIEKWNVLQNYFTIERNTDGDMFLNNSSNITYTYNQQTLGINYIKTLKLKLMSSNEVKSKIIKIILKSLDTFISISSSTNEYYHLSIIGNVKKEIKNVLNSKDEEKNVYASFLHLLNSFTLK